MNENRLPHVEVNRGGMHWLRFLLLGAILLGGVLAVPQPAHASTEFIVTSNQDLPLKTANSTECIATNDECTLRAAVQAANYLYPTPVRIVLQANTTYTLTREGRDENWGESGDLDVNNHVTIVGGGGNREADPSGTVVEAGVLSHGGIDRVFAVNGTWNRPVRVTFEAMTIRNGYLNSTNYETGYGAAIDFEAAGTGSLSIYNVIFEGNATTMDGGALGLINSETLSGASVTIDRATFRNNQAGLWGGAIYLGPNLPVTIKDSLFELNQTTSPVGTGGAIAVRGDMNNPEVLIENSVFRQNTAGQEGGAITSDGRLRIINSTIHDNVAGREGGGIVHRAAGGYPEPYTLPLTLHNVTISGNRAGQSGGGLWLNSVASHPVSMNVSLVNVTIANNQAEQASGIGEGGGIYRVPDHPIAVTMHTTIVTGNVTAGSPDNIYGDVQGTSSHNLIGLGGSGGLVHELNGNQVGVEDARLGALANNGAAAAVGANVPNRPVVLTHALLPGSPALDAGNNGLAPSGTDARGMPRPLDAADHNTVRTVDIGAYEAHPMIEAIADETIYSDQSLTVQFHVGDYLRGIDVVEAVSLNTALVPNANVSISGTGSQRTLTVTPAPGMSGIAPIDMTVRHTAPELGGYESVKTHTFTLNVLPRPDLAITATHSAPFRQGQAGATYSLTVTNLDVNSETGQPVGPTDGPVTVGITVPAGLSVRSLAGDGWACHLGTGTCTRSDALAAGMSFPPTTLTVDVDEFAPAEVTLDGSVTTTLDLTSGNNSISYKASIIQVADLTVGLTQTTDFNQGQAGVRYAVTIGNVGPGPTDALPPFGAPTELTITLPAGITVTDYDGTGWTGACTIADGGGSVTCSRTDILETGQEYPDLILTVTVARDAGNNLPATATVSGAGELRTHNNTANRPTLVHPAPDLAIVKVAQGTFRQGRTAIYTLTVTNEGSVPTNDTVTVVDMLPVHLSDIIVNENGWTCSLSGHALTCTNDEVLNPAQSYPAVSLTAKIADDAPEALINTVHVSGGGQFYTPNDSHTITTDVIPAPDLVISLAPVGTLTQGQIGVTYEIVVTNNGAGPTFLPFNVTPNLSEHLSISWANGTGWSCQPDTHVCTHAGGLAPGASTEPISLTVNVGAYAPPTVTSTASVAGGGELDSSLGDNMATDIAEVIQQPDLTVVKTTAGTFVQGETGAVYTITVTNSGTGLTSGMVVVEDSLPADLTPTAMGGDGWSCDLSSLSCSRSDVLEAGASYPDVTLTVDVSPTADSTVTNTVTVSGGGDTNTTNNTDSIDTVVVQLADMTVSTIRFGTLRQGQEGATYVITVSNSGQLPTTAPVGLVADLTAGLTAVDMSGNGWDCSLATLSCTRDDVLVNGDSYPVIILTVDVDPRAPASVTNTVTVSGGGEANLANNTSTEVAAVTQIADLTVSKTHVGDFEQGELGTYTITVSNVGDGPTDATVIVTDTLPTGLSAIAMGGDGWVCNLGTLTCTRSDVLASGGSYPAITLTVQVDERALASVTNTVTVSGGGEVTTTNNTATDSTTVIQRPDLVPAMSHTADFRQGQTGATYTISVANTGTGLTSGTVTAVADLPTGLTATGLSGQGWTCDLDTLTCTRTDALAADASYPAITLTVDVAPRAGATLTPSVTVSGGNDVNVSNNTVSNPTTVVLIADLEVSKSHTGDFRQGQVGATYTITVRNTGDGPTDAPVSVTDTLPAGLTATAIEGEGWDCVLATLSCTRDDVLASGDSYEPITLKVDVNPRAAASVTNTVTVAGGGEVVTTNNTDEDITAIVQIADLTVSKTHVGDFTQGETESYTIIVSNVGDGPTDAAVSVTDTLPTGLTATTMEGDGWSCNLGTLTCTRSDVLPAGDSYPAITLTVQVDERAPATVTNTVTVSGGGEVNTSNNTATDTTTVIQRPDLVPAMNHTFDFRQGQTGATYTIGVANTGTGSTSGTVTVEADLPTGLTATAMGGTGWTCDLDTLTCTRTDALAADASYPAITLTVDVAPRAGATLTPSVTVSGGNDVNVSNNTVRNPTTVVLIADLEVSKSHTGDFRQGQVGATYTITVHNTGDGPTDAPVSVTDTLPAGLTATAIEGEGWDCDLAMLSCTRADLLASGDSYESIILTVNVADDAPVSLTNTVTVSGGGEVVTTNNTDDDFTTVIPVADLTVTKSHAGDFTQGQNGVYTITVSNAGPGPTVGTVTVQDTLPTGMTAVSMSGTGWNCSPSAVTCSRSDVLAEGDSYPAITLTVSVDAYAPPSLTNLVTVSGGGELNTTNNSDDDVTTIIQQPDLVISKAPTGSFRQGDTGRTYTLTVTNAGTGLTEGLVTVTDDLPAGLTATAITGDGWDCTLANLTCTRSDVLVAGQSYEPISLTVDVDEHAPATVTNRATVSGGGDVDLTNNTADAVTPVIQAADLVITKTHAGDFRQGQQGAVFTMTVTNAGPGPTDSPVTVVDTLPAGLTAVALAGEGWSCNLSTLTCARADVLAAGASYPAITLTVNVAPRAPASLANRVMVAGGGELNTANNESVDTVTVTQIADLTVSMSHAGATEQGATGVTITSTVHNQGDGPTDAPVTVTITLPSDLTVVSMSGAGWTCDSATLVCERSDALAPGASYPAISLVVDVSPTAGPVLTSDAAVSGGGAVNTDNNDAVLDLHVRQLADLTVAKSHSGSFHRGQQNAPYLIVVRNVGMGPTDGSPVMVVDTLPTGLTAMSMEGDGWTCDVATVTCTRSDVLEPQESYPTITLRVRVAGNAPNELTNLVTVSGGGQVILTNDMAEDLTNIVPAPPPFVPPFVTIGAVPEITRETSITVSGSANQNAAVIVNGVLVRASGNGSWSATVPLTVEGPNAIEAINGTATAQVTVIRDTTPPPLTFTASATQTENDTVLLTASSREAGAVVRIEGQETTSLTVSLAVGQNLFTATATDTAGNVSTATVTVVRTLPPPPPPQEVIPSVDNHPRLLNQAAFTVTGQAPPASIVVLVVDGVEQGSAVVGSDGAYVLTGTLGEGPNRYYVQVTGGQSSAEQMVVYRPQAQVPPSRGFVDTQNHWAGNEVNLMANLGIVRGFEDGSFRPEANVTRLEFAVMVSRLLHLEGDQAALSFADNDSLPAWALTEVSGAVEAGIILGRGDGSFDPGAPVTRAEVAIMLVRAMDFLGLQMKSGEVAFADQSQIPNWASEFIAIAAEYGLIGGYPDGSFGPGDTATRGQAVTMLGRLYRLLSE